MRVVVGVILLLGAAICKADDAATVTTGKQGGRPVKFDGNLGTYYEGLVIALLGTCSAENDAPIATKERWNKALNEDHLRVSFTKARRFAVTRERLVEADEIVIPISAARAPDHIFVRSGDTYRAFAKYDHRICTFIQDNLKSLLAR